MFTASLIPLGPDMMFWGYRELRKAYRGELDEQNTISNQYQEEEEFDNEEDNGFGDNNSQVVGDAT